MFHYKSGLLTLFQFHNSFSSVAIDSELQVEPHNLAVNVRCCRYRFVFESEALPYEALSILSYSLSPQDGFHVWLFLIGVLIGF